MRVCKLAIIGGILLSLVALCANAQTRALRFITSSSIPPYFIVEESRGIVSDLMEEALALQGYDIHFSYSTNRRLMAELLSRRVDGAFNFPPGDIEGFYYSDPIVYYQNVAVTLSHRQFTIDTVDDLQDKSIIAFQNSALFLGPEFAAMASANPRFEEVSKQRSQLFMLFMERTDVIVLDLKIFLYYLMEIQQVAGMQQPFTIHPLFPIAPRYALFTDKKIRDDFNAGLKSLRNSGLYDDIVRRYLPQH